MLDVDPTTIEASIGLFRFFGYYEGRRILPMRSKTRKQRKALASAKRNSVPKPKPKYKRKRHLDNLTDTQRRAQMLNKRAAFIPEHDESISGILHNEFNRSHWTYDDLSEAIGVSRTTLHSALNLPRGRGFNTRLADILLRVFGLKVSVNPEQEPLESPGLRRAIDQLAD